MDQQIETTENLVITDFNTLPQYLTVNEVAALTRYSQRQVYVLASNGELPSFKPGGKKDAALLFRKDLVRNWIEQPYEPRKKRTAKVSQEPAAA